MLYLPLNILSIVANMYRQAPIIHNTTIITRRNVTTTIIIVSLLGSSMVRVPGQSDTCPYRTGSNPIT